MYTISHIYLTKPRAWGNYASFHYEIYRITLMKSLGGAAGDVLHPATAVSLNFPIGWWIYMWVYLCAKGFVAKGGWESHICC